MDEITIATRIKIIEAVISDRWPDGHLRNTATRFSIRLVHFLEVAGCDRYRGFLDRSATQRSAELADVADMLIVSESDGSDAATFP